MTCASWWHVSVCDDTWALFYAKRCLAFLLVYPRLQLASMQQQSACFSMIHWLTFYASSPLQYWFFHGLLCIYKVDSRRYILYIEGFSGIQFWSRFWLALLAPWGEDCVGMQLAGKGLHCWELMYDTVVLSIVQLTLVVACALSAALVFLVQLWLNAPGLSQIHGGHSNNCMYSYCGEACIKLHNIWHDKKLYLWHTWLQCRLIKSIYKTVSSVLTCYDSSAYVQLMEWNKTCGGIQQSILVN